MYATSYRTSSTEAGHIIGEVMQLADDLRKLDSASRRRGLSTDDPIQAELVGGKRALLHDRLQYLISLQGRRLKIEEAQLMAEVKAQAIKDVIDRTNAYVSGTGSEVDYLMADIFKAAIQDILQA